MKLTKSQRHTAYIIMLAEAELVKIGKVTGDFYKYIDGSATVGGLCDLLETILYDKRNDILLKYNLIELIEKRPDYTEVYWFSTEADGWQQRIALLKQCIIETY